MYFLQVLLNGFVLGTQVMLVTFSLYLVYLVSGVYHLALGGIGTATAYGLYWGLSNNLSYLEIAGLLLFLIFFLGTISYYLLASFVVKKEDTLALLVSFSFGIVLESIAAIIFGSDGKNFFEEVLPIVDFFGLQITITGLLSIIYAFVIAIFAWFIILKTSIGRILRGVAENSHLVSTLKINASRLRWAVFVLASATSAVIVILTTMNSALTPKGMFHLLIIAFISLLVGGVKSFKGGVIASFILTIVPSLITSFTDISVSWETFIVFVIAILLLLWKPNGLFSVKERT